YFPDPDLPPLTIDETWIARVKAALPELPEAKRQRFMADYMLSPADATSLTASAALARHFEATVQAGVQAKLATNWILGEFSAALNRDEIDASAAPVSGQRLGALLRRIEDGTISGKIAKEVFDAMWAAEDGGDPDAFIAARGLRQISDAGAIEKIVDEV